MKLHAYPGLAGHAIEHRRMNASLEEVRMACLGDEHESVSRLATELHDNLLQHIATGDRKFAQHMSSVEAAAQAVR